MNKLILFSVVSLSLTACGKPDVPTRPPCKIDRVVGHIVGRSATIEIKKCNEYYDCKQWQSFPPDVAEKCIEYNKFLDSEYIDD